MKLEKVASAVPSVKILDMRNMSTFEHYKYQLDLEKDLLDFALSDEALFKTVKSEEKFDLFMFDYHFNDALLGIAKYLGIPVIAVNSWGDYRWAGKSTNDPFNPSYTPNTFFGFTHEMSFWERLQNSVLSLIDSVAYQ